MERTTCCFAGCPQGCFSTWADENQIGKPTLKDILEKEIERLIVEEKITCFISGLTPGPDLACAELVLKLRKKYPQIHLECAVPYEEQAVRWTVPQRDKYYDILAACDKLTQLQTSYTKDCLKKHTWYLVDKSGYVLAVWDGTWRGKTGHLILEARKLGRRITTIEPVTRKVNQWSNDSRV